MARLKHRYSPLAKIEQILFYRGTLYCIKHLVCFGLKLGVSISSWIYGFKNKSIYEIRSKIKQQYMYTSVNKEAKTHTGLNVRHADFKYVFCRVLTLKRSFLFTCCLDIWTSKTNTKIISTKSVVNISFDTGHKLKAMINHKVHLLYKVLISQGLLLG